jgi:hypothetical protein
MQAHEVQLITRTPVARWGGTSAWTVGVAVGVVVAFLLGTPTVGTADEGDDDFRCEGLHGVCLGLCTAADALGCLDDESDQPSIELVCRKIEKQLKKSDCELPPPPVTCPCEGITDGRATWDDTFQTKECVPITGIFRGIVTWSEMRATSLQAAEQAEQGERWLCGVVTCSPYPQCFATNIDITQLEYQACVQRLETIAANDNVTCP